MASKSGWTFDDVPDQTGKTAIVTGSNSGIGLETARFLVMRGASVILAVRNSIKAPKPWINLHRLNQVVKLR